MPILVMLEPANIDKLSFEGERTEGLEMDLSLTTKDGYVVVITESMVGIIADGLELAVEGKL